MRILFSGGGTLGSVTPLLALAEELRRRGDQQFLWLGTRRGVEKALVEACSLPFRGIFSGKLRRYFSWQNFMDPFFIAVGFLQSFFIMIRFRPDYILTAGGFVAAPVVWAGWLLRKPILAHQQDLSWGLANKLMRPFASRITVNFEKNFKDLPKRYQKKTIIVGNPVRQQILDILNDGRDKELIFKKFNLETGVPVVLALGGGTGALRLNEIIAEAMPELYKFCQVLHLTGKEKKVTPAEGEWQGRHHWQEFLIKEMPDAYVVADLVITRAGIGTLSELSAIGKPTIIVPIPRSHQGDNAKYFADNGGAVVLDQEKLTPASLTKTIYELLSSKEALDNLAAGIKKLANPEAAKEIVEFIKL